MCGGFSVLKDVLKTSVYALARYRNACHLVIPERVLSRAPSAELAPNQTDQDTLPNYEVLDAIIMHYMEEKLTIESIVALGYDHTMVEHIIRLIKRNEYKRRQSAPGVKVSTCAFGRDWRYPITSKFNQ
jgi:NAD+ synthase (glutamine-hydrolysing)